MQIMKMKTRRFIISKSDKVGIGLFNSSNAFFKIKNLDEQTRAINSYFNESSRVEASMSLRNKTAGGIMGRFWI